MSNSKTILMKNDTQSFETNGTWIVSQVTALLKYRVYYIQQIGTENTC